MLTVLNEQIKCLQMILSADMIDTSEGNKQLHMLNVLTADLSPKWQMEAK